MPGFGSLAPTSDYTKTKNGMYPATITAAKVLMEDGQPKLHPESHKMSIDVSFQLDATNDEGNPIELQRRFGYTFGKNRTTGAYSNWAMFVEAATGVACGDAAQHHVGDKELTGRRLNVRTKNAESNGNKYTNIVDFEPIEEEAPRPAPRAAAHAPAAAVGLEEDDLSSLPF